MNNIIHVLFLNKDIPHNKYICYDHNKYLMNSKFGYYRSSNNRWGHIMLSKQCILDYPLTQLVIVFSQKEKLYKVYNMPMDDLKYFTHQEIASYLNKLTNPYKWQGHLDEMIS